MFRKPRFTYKEVHRFIQTEDPVEGLEQEISYINNLYGKEGKDWFLVEKIFNMVNSRTKCNTVQRFMKHLVRRPESQSFSWSEV